MKRKELIERWEGEFSLKNLPPYKSLVNGLKDYRGMILNSWPVNEFNELTDIDFSFSELTNGISSSKVENCVFDSVKQDGDWASSKVIDCTFLKGKLDITIMDCIVENTIFKKVNFAKTTIVATSKFKNCVFENCNFKKTIVYDDNPIFENCVFIDNQYSYLSTFSDGNFLNCDLSQDDFSEIDDAKNPMLSDEFYNKMVEKYAKKD